MAMTSAERQMIYRAGRQTGGSDGNGERRVNTWINTATYLALRRLAKRYGISQRQVLERLIRAEDDAVLAGMEIDTPEWDKYFAMGPGTAN